MIRWQPFVILFFFAISLLAPILAFEAPMHSDVNAQLQPPSANHPLGTDMLGRDVFSRLLYGGQRTLLIAGLATLIAVIVGGMLGITAGIANHYVDYVLSGIINMFLAFPAILIALIVLTVSGAGQYRSLLQLVSRKSALLDV